MSSTAFPFILFVTMAHIFHSCISVAKPRSIRFQDEDTTEAEGAEGADAEGKEEGEEEEGAVEAKPVTPLQAAMLRMAAEKVAKLKEESERSANDDEEVGDERNYRNMLSYDDLHTFTAKDPKHDLYLLSMFTYSKGVNIPLNLNVHYFVDCHVAKFNFANLLYTLQSKQTSQVICYIKWTK